MLIRQNKWQAAHHGLDAQLVDSTTYQLQPVCQFVHELVEALRRTAEQLGCWSFLERVRELTDRPT